MHLKNTERISIRTSLPAILEFKIRKFIGKYEKITEKNLGIILFDFENFKEKQNKIDLIKDLENLTAKSYITPLDIVSVCHQNHFHTDMNILTTLLLRNSKSLHKIDTKVITNYLLPKLISKMSKSKREEQKKSFLSPSDPKYIRNDNIRRKSKRKDSIEDHSKVKKIQSKLFKYSDALFQKDLTLCGLIHKKILDKVIDGKEVQFIKRPVLMKAFESIGVQLTNPEVEIIKNILRPSFQDYVDIDTLQNFFTPLGLIEEVPASSKHLDFTKLGADEIRLFNRIIQEMEEEYHNMGHKNTQKHDIIDFLGPEN